MTEKTIQLLETIESDLNKVQTDLSANFLPIEKVEEFLMRIKPTTEARIKIDELTIDDLDTYFPQQSIIEGRFLSWSLDTNDNWRLMYEEVQSPKHYGASKKECRPFRECTDEIKAKYINRLNDLLITLSISIKAIHSEVLGMEY